MTIVKFLVRVSIIIVFVILKTLTRKDRYAYMLRYLCGKGDIKVAEKHLKTFNIEFWARKLRTDYEYGYRPIHSTHYQSSGFYGRPELFYLVGGFDYDVFCDDEQVHIVAEDVYDWHPSIQEDGVPMYFASPLPISLEWDKWETVCWSINSFLGAIVLQESFDTTVSISNYFWEWLGGAEFTSRMMWTFDIDQFDDLYHS